LLPASATLNRLPKEFFMRGLLHFMNVIPNTREARVRACPERPSLARNSNEKSLSLRDVIPNRRAAAVRNLLFACVVFVLAASAFAQAKHPFTFEDMMKLKRVGEPEVSPDGKWVIFSVVDVDLAANTKIPHIWIVPLSEKAGSSPASGGLGMTSEREIIADQDADRPRWAPDGKRFAFISTKQDGSQVWIAEFDGATGTVTGIRQWTKMPTEASGELWSPDGKHIIFTSDVYPECDRDPMSTVDCNAKKVKEVDDSKVKALIFDHLLYRHWNAYKAGKRTHIFLMAAPDSASGGGWGTTAPVALNLTPGDYDAPVFSLGGQDDYAFSPDGQEICYTSNHDKNPAASTNNDLWIVPVNPGSAIAANRLVLLPPQAKNITADNPASDSTPLYAPDGRYIAYRAQQRPGYESDRFRLMLYDRKTGEKKNLTENWDHWVGSFDWAGSHEIILTAEDIGESPIYTIMPEGCPNGCNLTKILEGFNDDVAASKETVNGKGVNSTSELVVFSQMSLQSPSEIFAAEPGTCSVDIERFREALSRESRESSGCAIAKPRQLTHLNDAVLAQIAMSQLDPFWFPGAHGDKVEGFLVKPPKFDASKRYPVKFLIHGGPEGAWGDDWSYRWNPELFASPTPSTPSGYVVIMINFHGSTGYGQKFIDAINGDWGGAPFEDLMKGLDYAEQTYPFIDKARECALGASYGGYMINWIEGHTDRFKCLVSHDGMFNAESAWGTTEELWFNDWEFKGTPYDNRESYRKWSPHEYAKNFKTPMLVIHGQKDYRLDVSQGFDLFTTLQMEGIPSKMLYFPDEGHWVLKPQNSQLWYKTVNDWVDQWIGDQRIGK
jgi:dipeptidyl aminopeptidase/acylaminoacyl peptidase